MSNRRSNEESRDELEELREKHLALFAVGGFLLFAVVGLGVYVAAGWAGWVPLPQWVLVAWGIAVAADVIVFSRPETKRLGRLSAEREE